jgi:hypothetical protein
MEIPGATGWENYRKTNTYGGMMEIRVGDRNILFDKEVGVPGSMLKMNLGQRSTSF